MDYIRQVAPGARKMTTEIYGSTKNGVLYSEGMDLLQSVVPDVLTTSIFSSADYRDPELSLFKKVYDNGCYLVCAAGNSGTNKVRKLAQGDMWKAIGSCRYNKGNPYLATYSSTGEELDYVSFDNLYSTYDNKKHTGTSFASPLLAAMIALIQGFFIDKTGKKLTHDKLNKFLQDYSMDLGEEGFDDYYGHGLLRLPNPEDIVISDYSDMITIEEVFDFLIKEGELLEPDYWRKKIAEEDKIKWFFIKWANAVRMARKTEKKELTQYNIEDVMDSLVRKGWLLEPQYWINKIEKEDKLKWLFLKWHNATERVM